MGFRFRFIFMIFLTVFLGYIIRIHQKQKNKIYFLLQPHCEMRACGHNYNGQTVEKNLEWINNTEDKILWYCTVL